MPKFLADVSPGSTRTISTVSFLFPKVTVTFQSESRSNSPSFLILASPACIIGTSLKRLISRYNRSRSLILSSNVGFGNSKYNFVDRGEWVKIIFGIDRRYFLYFFGFLIKPLKPQPHFLRRQLLKIQS